MGIGGASEKRRVRVWKEFEEAVANLRITLNFAARGNIDAQVPWNVLECKWTVGRAWGAS